MPPSHFSRGYFHFVFSFRSEIYDQLPLAPLTANHTTTATNPEHRSAAANNTTNVRRVASDRFSSVVTSTPEKPKTITTSATRLAPGKTMRHSHARKERKTCTRKNRGDCDDQPARKSTCVMHRDYSALLFSVF